VKLTIARSFKPGAASFKLCDRALSFWFGFLDQDHRSEAAGAVE
jgi:hypothetical protein